MLARPAASLSAAWLPRAAASAGAAGAAGRPAVWRPGSGALRGFAAGRGSGYRQGQRQAILAKAYLREYVKAKNIGDIPKAMHLLEKATAAAEHVHIWIPDTSKDGDRSLVPLSAIVPSFSYDEGASPRLVLPATVDGRHSEEHREVSELPLPNHAHPAQSPMALVIPFDPNNASGNGKW